MKEEVNQIIYAAAMSVSLPRTTPSKSATARQVLVLEETVRSGKECYCEHRHTWGLANAAVEEGKQEGNVTER